MKFVFKILLVFLVSAEAWGSGILKVQDTIPQKRITPEVFPKWQHCKESDGSKSGFFQCLQIFLQENIQNPKNINGRANAKVRISAEGKAEILDISASDVSLKEEAYRLVAQMPNFIPAQSDGTATNYDFLLPLSFRKEETYQTRPKVFRTPDVFPKWSDEVSDKNSVEAFENKLQELLFDGISSTDIESKPQRVYVLVRVTDEGHLLVNEFYSEQEEIIAQIRRNILKMPKLIPAKHKRKNVHFERVYSYMSHDFFSEKVAKNSVIEFPILGDCEGMIGKKTIEGFQRCCHRNIQEKFIYPQEAIEKDIQGVVYVAFEILKEGKLKVKALLGGEEILKVGALYVVQQISVVQPAKIDGKPTTFHFTIPITFKME